ncbi:lipopolysaccharide biosynthesis protein [Olsenella massiliensis]|uniref:lipopolysaccharide biosynthesis protein n=1 Tax=Olsenella massiliensis TaxID=1622075 RepID=UPI000AF0CAD6|nr:lipopolysaccharide biosynthesis protein [Olsenella massiliensis]
MPHLPFRPTSARRHLDMGRGGRGGARDAASQRAFRYGSLVMPQSREGDRERSGPRQPLLARLANQWWDRLIAAVFSGSLADQTARYASHSTTLDYAFNSVGLGVWGALFPLLTMVSSQLVGTEQAGMFSMAFVYANLIQFVGMYGVRTYQVSDVDETNSFGAYQLQRVLTCLFMAGAGWLLCALRGYGQGEMLTICLGTFSFRVVDSIADVYEGRLQQQDKLWLSGLSQVLRCAGGIVAFCLALVLTRGVATSSMAMAGVAAASLLLVTIPLTYFETERSRGWELVEVRQIFVDCAPTFLATFLFSLIETVPKFAMEGSLPYDSQLFFNAIYFPAQGIAMSVSLIYRPQLVRLATIWSNPSHRKRFDLIVIVVIALAVGITVAMVAFNALVGIPLLNLLYGTDFEPLRNQLYLMVVAGGLSAVVDFLYQIITVQRRQELASRLYLIAFGVSVLLSMTLVRVIGFEGAVYAYALSMAALFLLLASQYVVVRVRS